MILFHWKYTNYTKSTDFMNFVHFRTETFDLIEIEGFVMHASRKIR